MPQRNVASNFTFEQQRVEINNLAQDFWTQKGTVDTAAPTYLKHDGSNDFTGQTLVVPNAFTINSNSGNGTVTISGNLDVTGTTTTVNSANLEVTDKNILIAKGSTSDSQADGAGITIDSATDITFNFVDAKDALVSSIGLEGTTFLKAPYGQFTGSGTPGGGQGVEINAPDTNTGQIISYDRANTAYKELRVKGSSVGIYGGTTNALVGTFNSTGLSMESGKTITGDLTGDVTGNADTATTATTAANITLSDHASDTECFLVFAQAPTLAQTPHTNTNLKFNSQDGTLSVQKLEGTIVTAAQASITSVGTLTGLAVNGNLTITGGIVQNDDSAETAFGSKSLPAADSGYYVRNGNGGTGTYSSIGLIASSTSAASDQSASLIAKCTASGLSPEVYLTQRDGNNSQRNTIAINTLGDITIIGGLIPNADDGQNLGSSTKRWANVYTADAHFNNIGTGGNEVDGSEGHWTMQEGENDFFLINRKNGKKYKFNLTEVS